MTHLRSRQLSSLCLGPVGDILPFLHLVLIFDVETGESSKSRRSIGAAPMPRLLLDDSYENHCK